MRPLLLLVAVFLLHGCAPKRVSSPEELHWRLGMLNKGINPDTGETLAETERRKAQSSANFQRDLSNLSGTLRQQRANVESASRGSSVAQDKARAESSARYAAVIADRPSQSDSSARSQTRERERKAEVAKREEAAAEAKRKREQVAQTRSKEESDLKDAERSAEERVKRQQEALDLKNQQERDRRRSETEAKAKAERERLDRERIAVAEAERKKADSEKRAKDERMAQANYLSQLGRGIKLGALTCPGGDGKHYIVGHRPKIKPEVVSCIDVSYVATCKGERQGISGVAKNFVGAGTDCFFGDAAEVSPTPSCKASEVKVSVTKVAACGN